MTYEHCDLCPRKCYVNRAAGQTGWCGAPATALVAKIMLHQWEEPALAPNGKSGAVFFGGCTLGCAFCLSGAGPTLLLITRDKGLREKLEKRLPGITTKNWEILPLHIDFKGAYILDAE